MRRCASYRQQRGNEMSVNRPVETAPRPRTNWAAAIVGIVILAVVGGWAYVSTRPKPAAVVRRDIVGLIPVNGEVIAPPSARADVMSPYRAPVDKVETSVGARVHRGDVLVVLSFPDIQAAVEQARVSVKSAETAYANAAKQYDDAIRAAMKQSWPTSPPSSTQTNPDQPGGDTGAPAVQATPVPDSSSAAAQLKPERDNALIPYKQQLEAAREAYQAAKSG